MARRKTDIRFRFAEDFMKLKRRHKLSWFDMSSGMHLAIMTVRRLGAGECPFVFPETIEKYEEFKEMLEAIEHEEEMSLEGLS